MIPTWTLDSLKLVILSKFVGHCKINHILIAKDAIVDGRYQVNYDDGDHESLNLASENWCVADSL